MVDSTGDVPRRPLGDTGVEVSALGLGGYHLGLVETYGEVERIVHEAVDSGVTSWTTPGSTTTARARSGWGGRSRGGGTAPSS
jgi:hypothetical protein